MEGEGEDAAEEAVESAVDVVEVLDGVASEEEDKEEEEDEGTAVRGFDGSAGKPGATTTKAASADGAVDTAGDRAEAEEGVGESCGDSPPLRTDSAGESGGTRLIDASEGRGGRTAAMAAMPDSCVEMLCGGRSPSSSSSSSSTSETASSKSISASSSESIETASRAGAGEPTLPPPAAPFVLTHRGTARSAAGPGDAECERAPADDAVLGLRARRREGEAFEAVELRPTMKAGEDERPEGWSEGGERARRRRPMGEGELDEVRGG